MPCFLPRKSKRIAPSPSVHVGACAHLCARAHLWSSAPTSASHPPRSAFESACVRRSFAMFLHVTPVRILTLAPRWSPQRPVGPRCTDTPCVCSPAPRRPRRLCGEPPCGWIIPKEQCPASRRVVFHGFWLVLPSCPSGAGALRPSPFPGPCHGQMRTCFSCLTFYMF